MALLLCPQHDFRIALPAHHSRTWEYGTLREDTVSHARASALDTSLTRSVVPDGKVIGISPFEPYLQVMILYNHLHESCQKLLRLS